MSATYAAELARLKVTYPLWTITRASGPDWHGGLYATRPGFSRVTAVSPGVLAGKLIKAEGRRP